MSHISEKTFNDDKLKWLEGHDSIERLIKQYNEDLGSDFVCATL